ncbi:MAG: prolyl oligopeptidase family serine peptidase [Acidobacteriota bacterium]
MLSMFFRNPRTASLRRLALLGFLTTALVVGWPAVAADSGDPSGEEASQQIDLATWLVLDPATVPLPAFADDEYSVAELLAESLLPTADRWADPADGDAVAWPPGTPSHWSRRSSVADGAVFAAPDLDQPAVAWLATYVEVDRFVDATLVVEGAHLLRVFLDQPTEEVASKTEADVQTDDEEADVGQASAAVTLDAGQHLILVETLYDPAAEAPWSVAAHLEVADHLADSITVDLDPRRRLELVDLLDAERVRDVDLSPDGRHAALFYRAPGVPAEHVEEWIDLVAVDDGRVVRTLRGGQGDFHWTPTGDGYLYGQTGSVGTDLYLANLADGAVRVIARDLNDVWGVRLFPDGDSILLEIGESAEADEREVKRYRDLPDRWAGRRDRQHLVQLFLDGSRRRLAVGGTNDAVQDIRPDGGAILIARTTHGLATRPFSETELIEIDLATLQPRAIRTLGWFGEALYSPDGSTLLVTGSPSLFDGLGRDVDLGDEQIANDYDNQAYLLDLTDPSSVQPITRDFDPSLREVVWSRHDGAIYATAQDGTRRKIFRRDAANGSFVELPSGVDAVDGLDLAESSPRLVYTGSSSGVPFAPYVRETATGAAPRALAEPAADRWSQIELTGAEPWTFETEDGTTIDGHVYLPPGYDPEASERYPLIVYYYGGTVPSGLGFGGRYPGELWAARGYVVYVPQPSGADGYGQEFSARHVNAWGQRTAEDILEGTERFLAAHPAVDSERVGCIGASYGGFMTMYLQTRTDRFAAAISHAGISNLASYWGQGWWGYLYSAAASANSYPWNARDLYIEQSPLYHADRINTPLLLLHGDADTNVPPVESHQMYTALKLLDREVELIEIGGQNHQIVFYPQRVLWAKTILAWFDRWLKDQPEAWEHLWGTEDDPKG